MRNVLLLGLTMSALAVPTADAQSADRNRESVQMQMPAPGRVSMLGVRLSDVSAEAAKALKLPKPEGAVVESVRPNSPAAASGLRDKDVIVQFDGERVRSARHLTRLVAETPAGRSVTVGVLRDGRRTDLTVTPQTSEGFEPRFGGIEIDSDQWRENIERAREAMRDLGQNLPEVVEGTREGLEVGRRGRLGVNVQELNSELAAYFGVKSGVLVVSVSAESAAAKSGLKAGDVITAANGTPVRTPRELVLALPSGDRDADVALTVVRDKKETTIKATLTAPASTNRPAPGRRV